MDLTPEHNVRPSSKNVMSHTKTSFTHCSNRSTPADVELVDVTKRFGSVVAVDCLNLTIPAGTYTCLLGPSGCGKTTTLRLLAGHERVTLLG